MSISKRTVKVKIIPADITADDLEDLLATDDLFIEYFNSFLSLPSFPEPLCFNKETAGFEIVSNDRAKLAQEIKAAVRAGRRKKHIYHVTRNHAFSSIPLIAIDDCGGDQEQEIDTRFSIKTLNKEQGIEWVKEERLPAFLESDCYLEYRLARLVSQTQIARKPNEFVDIKIDYSAPAPKTEEEPEEEEEENVEEKIMKNMYVCMGNCSTTETDSWVSQAKIALDLTTTTVTSTRPSSALVSSMPSRPPLLERPQSSRVRSAGSRVHSAQRSVTDSGVYSGSRTASESRVQGTDHDLEEEAISEDTSEVKEEVVGNLRIRKPVTPRPSQTVCVVSDEIPGHGGPGAIYVTPKREATWAVDEEEEERTKDEDAESGIQDDEEFLSDKPVVVDSLDDLGAVVVGTVLKHALSELSGQDIIDVMAYPALRDVFPNKKYIKLTKNVIEQLEFVVEEPCDSLPEAPEEDLPDDMSPIALGKDSDEDSLLNSDDDYDEERDTLFKKRKPKQLTLSSITGLGQFKKFLKGTLGEKNWNFWMDIERSRMLQSTPEMDNYIIAMRERYYKVGAPLRLSQQQFEEHGLSEPQHWTVDRLQTLQTSMVEPLLLYWGPRFLIKQQTPVHPETNYLYKKQKELITPPPEVHPTPAVTPLLPLRPKTCAPKLQPSTAQVTDMFAKEEDLISDIKTTPPVGQKRKFSLPDMFASFQEKSDKDKENNDKKKKKKDRTKTPRALVSSQIEANRGAGSRRSSNMSRPPSAPARMASSEHSAEGVSDPWGASLRPGSAGSAAGRGRRRSSTCSVASDASAFLGGTRMEGLLQALASDSKAGGFFRKSLEKTGNTLWKNCLLFWDNLQKYHNIFYSDILHPYLLEKKAKFLYSRFIMLSAPLSIQCNDEIRDAIYKKLDPPFEELYDAAEEYAIAVLFDAWSQSLAIDMTTFDKVELVEVNRHLDGKSKYVVALQRRGIIKERAETPEDTLANYKGPVYDEAVWKKVPDEFRDFTLEKLVHNRVELEHFRQFLAENYASMDLLCWMDIETFKRITHTEEKRRDLKAKDIKVKYFTRKYFFGPNSPAGRLGQEKVMAVGGGWGKLLEDRPPTASLLEAQKYVRERLERKWLPLFLITETFEERQRPQSSMDDVVEDVLIQRTRRSQAIWKMLESRWVTSSQDILTFRKALCNPMTSLQFRRYVSIKGDHLENDVLFWQECQRYKDMCHIHSDRSLIQQKTSAIINCFVDSPIPPNLQIDITSEMADKIMERKLEATPYLFREPQLTVFRVLFSHWQDFCHMRSNLTEDKILPTLERHRRRAKAQEKRKQREADEKQERELQRRKELGLPIREEDEESYDPFGGGGRRQGALSDDGGSVVMDGKNVSWSYSQYMQALDKEEVLNDVDSSTFSSLEAQDQTENGGKEKTTETPDKQKKEDNSKRVSQEDPRGPSEQRPRSAKTSETGSQTENRLRKRSAKARTAPSKSDPPASSEIPHPNPNATPKPSVSTPSAAISITTHAQSPPPGVPLHTKQPSPPPEAKPVQPQRMARGMPPLVSKK